MNNKLMNIFYIVSGLATIMGVNLVMIFNWSPKSWFPRVLFICGTLIFVILTYIFQAKNKPLVGKKAMIETEKRLLLNTKQTAIIFAGDMSWAQSYFPIIKRLVENGKTIKVIYRSNIAQNNIKFKENKRLIENAGATLYPYPLGDSGIRALLIDPEDPPNTIVYETYRKLKPKGIRVEEVESGNEASYNYWAKIYKMDSDFFIVNTLKRIFELVIFLSSKNKKPFNSGSPI